MHECNNLISLLERKAKLNNRLCVASFSYVWVGGWFVTQRSSSGRFAYKTSNSLAILFCCRNPH